MGDLSDYCISCRKRLTKDDYLSICKSCSEKEELERKERRDVEDKARGCTIGGVKLETVKPAVKETIS